MVVWPCGCKILSIYLARSRDYRDWSSLGKLELFSLQRVHITDNIPEDLTFDHGFECCGGDGIAQLSMI